MSYLPEAPDPGRDAFGRIAVETAAHVWREAQRARLISAVDTAVVFHDIGRLSARISCLQEIFPREALHAVAIKANPLVAVLRRAVEAGAGLEAASVEEVHLALASGCPPDHVVFDSPAKTDAELAFAFEQGLVINADSLDELRRIAGFAPSLRGEARVGLRVNPLVGEGTIAATSVGGALSRFGVPLDREGEARVVEAFRAHPWLSGLHLHVGSQGCDLPMLVAAAARALRLREAIHQGTRAQVSTLDIGGGVPTTYLTHEPRFTPVDYAAALRAQVPDLFTSGVRVITEFGRAIQAGCGFAVARVEAIKEVAGARIAVLHLGADLLMRAAYQPLVWRHEFAVLDAEGRPKIGGEHPWTLAGPLCFAGDVIARDVPLPPIDPGDHVLVRDVGAYTLGLWSHHCNRAIPLVLGYDGEPTAPAFCVLRHRDTPEDIVARWSP